MSKFKTITGMSHDYVDSQMNLLASTQKVEVIAAFPYGPHHEWFAVLVKLTPFERHTDWGPG